MADPQADGAPAHSTAGLGGALKRGIAWSTADTVLLRLGQFGMSIVIARLVAPKQFGVFVVAMTVYLIVINVSEIGVSVALVREVDNADRIAPTVSTIAMLNSIALAAAMYFSAPALATALGAPAAVGAVRVLTIPLVLAGPTAVPSALLSRDFQQKRRFIADLANFSFANGILLLLALHGGGVMALAWSRAAGQAASCVLLYVVAPKRYWPGFNLREARRLLRFGLPLAGSNLAGFTLANIDFITVGRLAGPVQLGYYNLAWNVSSWPVSVFTTALSSVTLPALARVEGGISEIARHVAAAMGALCGASFPTAALSIALADPLVTTLYGARWAPASRVLEILAVFGAIRVIVALLSDLFVAVGKTRRLFELQLIWLGALIPAMIVWVHFDKSTGASIAHVTIASAVVLPAYLLVLTRSVRIPLYTVIRPAIRPLLSSIVAGAATALAARQMSGDLEKLLLGGACFAGIYIALLGRWPLRLRAELKSLYGHADDGVGLDDRPHAEAPLAAASRYQVRDPWEARGGDRFGSPAADVWYGTQDSQLAGLKLLISLSGVGLSDPLHRVGAEPDNPPPRRWQRRLDNPQPFLPVGGDYHKPVDLSAVAPHEKRPSTANNDAMTSNEEGPKRGRHRKTVGDRADAGKEWS